MSDHCCLLSEAGESASPRYRQLAARERARNRVKGAAAVIKRWPRHWTILLNYWWIGMAVLAFTTYIIYSGIFVYVAHSFKLHRAPVLTKNLFETPKSLTTPTKLSVPPKVFMHIFADENQEVNLDNYLPYIDIVANKYSHLKFELIVVANDNIVEVKRLNDRDRNDLAFNSLWGENVHKEDLNSNLNIKYVTLSTYFDDSPLRDHWEELSLEMQKFLVRAISVWEKAGIAFDPVLLTPETPNSIYIDKIYKILKRYNLKKATFTHKPNKKVEKAKFKPNNIRDIINALVEEKPTDNQIEEQLVADETKNISMVYVEREKRSPILNSTAATNKKSRLKDTIQFNQEKHGNGTSTYNLLPMFLEYLFHNKPMKTEDTTPKTDIGQDSTLSHERNISKSIDKVVPAKYFWNELVEQNKVKPVIVSAKRVVDESMNEPDVTSVTEKLDSKTDFEVTIDLKGNIIATDTACHAFIGNMFSNVVHYDKNVSVTDFVIKELSGFCKGLLASCAGIDVILM